MMLHLSIISPPPLPIVLVYSMEQWIWLLMVPVKVIALQELYLVSLPVLFSFLFLLHGSHLTTLY